MDTNNANILATDPHFHPAVARIAGSARVLIKLSEQIDITDPTDGQNISADVLWEARGIRSMLILNSASLIESVLEFALLESHRILDYENNTYRPDKTLTIILRASSLKDYEKLFKKYSGRSFSNSLGDLNEKMRLIFDIRHLIVHGQTIQGTLVKSTPGFLVSQFEVKHIIKRLIGFGAYEGEDCDHIEYMFNSTHPSRWAWDTACQIVRKIYEVLVQHISALPLTKQLLDWVAVQDRSLATLKITYSHPHDW